MILACIAEHVKSGLQKLIHEDQKGFITGRFIGENIRTIYDIIFETKRLNIPGLIMLIDFEKVSWEFINYVLKTFNFGHTISNWISLLYNNSSSRIIQNGHISDSFRVGRGCPQGDSLSQYISFFYVRKYFQF